MRLVNYLCLPALLLLSQPALRGQDREYEVMNDTSFESHKPLVIPEIVNVVYEGLPDRLPDGKWKYYRVSKFTPKHNRSNTILYEGEFKDSVRNGRFIIYHYLPFRGKVSVPFVVMNYRSGLLDGPVVVYDSHGRKRVEGYFKDGKRHGLFISNRLGDECVFPESIDLFWEDQLIYSATYLYNAGIEKQKFVEDEQ